MEKRTDCGRSPCSAPAEKPCLVSDLNSTSTSRLRLQKISALRTSATLISVRSARRLSASSTTAKPATMVGATLAALDTVISLGFCRNASARRLISGAMVAEKNSVWRIGETNETIFSTSGMNPMSSMRSASSITRNLVSFSISPPRSNRSSRRPGVAISTSTPFSSAARWSFMLSPPISSAWVSFRWRP